jgi:hypothetical protein
MAAGRDFPHRIQSNHVHTGRSGRVTDTVTCSRSRPKPFSWTIRTNSTDAFATLSSRHPIAPPSTDRRQQMSRIHIGVIVVDTSPSLARITSRVAGRARVGPSMKWLAAKGRWSDPVATPSTAAVPS